MAEWNDDRVKTPGEEFEEEPERERDYDEPVGEEFEPRLRRRPEKEGGISRKGASVIVMAAICVSLLTGYSVASGALGIVGITTEGSSYTVSEAASPNFPYVPSAELSQIPGAGVLPGIGACTSGPLSYPGPATNTYEAFLWIGLNGSQCQPNDWELLFVFNSPADLPKSETVVVSATLVIGGQALDTSGSVTVAGGNYPGQPELQISIDLGASMPSAGVTSIGLTLT